METLCGTYSYFNSAKGSITHLSLQSSRIKSICAKTMHEILYDSEIKSLNLVRNGLIQIPPILNRTLGKLTTLWLSGNPVHCDCGMLWLISWLNNTRVSGKRVVQDYQDVICKGGKLDGIPVYKLDKIHMGCYPETMPTVVIVFASVISGLILVSMILVITIHRRWNAVRWIIYKNFNRLIGISDRDTEMIENMQFDAFLSYWYSTLATINIYKCL